MVLELWDCFHLIIHFVCDLEANHNLNPPTVNLPILPKDLPYTLVAKQIRDEKRPTDKIDKL